MLQCLQPSEREKELDMKRCLFAKQSQLHLLAPGLRANERSETGRENIWLPWWRLPKPTIGQTSVSPRSRSKSPTKTCGGVQRPGPEDNRPAGCLLIPMPVKQISQQRWPSSGSESRGLNNYTHTQTRTHTLRPALSRTNRDRSCDSFLIKWREPLTEVIRIQVVNRPAAISLPPRSQSTHSFGPRPPPSVSSLQRAAPLDEVKTHIKSKQSIRVRLSGWSIASDRPTSW